MCKKLGLTALLIVGGLFALSKLDLLWHVKDAARKARTAIRIEIPAEDKIARLKDALRGLKPEKEKHLGVIADEELKIERLAKDIAATKTNLTKWEGQIKDLQTVLKDESKEFVTVGLNKVSRAKVQTHLAQKWEAFKDAETAMKSQEELLGRRKEMLAAAQSKLRAMEVKEKELRTKVETLELELAKLREAQLVNDIPIDDSRFSKVVSLFNEVEQQIAKEKKVMEMKKGVTTDVEVEEALDQKARVEKAMKEMEERFGESRLAVQPK